MNRRWLQVGAVLSLLILAILIGGYFLEMGIVRADTTSQQGSAVIHYDIFAIGEGRVMFLRSNQASPSPPFVGHGLHFVFGAKWTRWWDPRTFLWEFRWAHYAATGASLSSYGTIGFMPLWTLMVPCLALPWLWRRRHLAERKAKLIGCCPVCGYDLRATPDKTGPRLDRCPECGTLTSGANAT